MQAVRRLLTRAGRFGLRQLAAACEVVLLTRMVPGRIQGPIFIIGPPRSGTTLLYSALVYCFRMAFLTDVHNCYWRAPILTTRLSAKRVEQARRPHFDSEYAQIEGRYAPAECGNFWYRWFPRGMDVYVPSGGLSRHHLYQMQQTLSGIQEATGMPVLFKNTYNSMRIGPLVETFPNACFLVCRRDPVDTAQSLLRGRIDYYGDTTRWLSLPPREYEDIKLGSPAEQVVDQVFFIERQIAADRERFGAERFLDVHYEESCKRPRAVAANVREFLHKLNVRVEDYGELPASFPFSTGCKIDPDDYAAIVGRVRERYATSLSVDEGVEAESGRQAKEISTDEAKHED